MRTSQQKGGKKSRIWNKQLEIQIIWMCGFFKELLSVSEYGYG